MSDSKFIRGTIIIALGTFITKFLGMIYVFPFERLVGTQGGALYTYGYVPYTIFLSIATMGVPLAVSKFVSKYNSLGEYSTSRKMLRTGFSLMIVMGVISFLTLYSIAPIISPYIIGDDPHGNTVEDVTKVIRMVSFALLVVPAMSLIRGFFQGHQSMGPTTVSQIVEQIVRIAFLLIGSFIVIKGLDGTIPQAINVSTFAAFIGALGGSAILAWYWVKRKHHFEELVASNPTKPILTTKEMMKEIMTYAAPFVFVGLAIPLYQQIDSFTFNRAMSDIGQGDVAESAFSIFTMWGHKLIMIPVSLATAFSLTLVPAITKYFVSGQMDVVKKQISQTIQITFFLTLPAVVGMSLLATPIYNTFYQLNELGGDILKWYAPVALLFSLYSVLVAILQGLNLQRFAVFSLSIGVLIKMFTNVPLIHAFETYGAIISTALGYTASIVYTYLVIRRSTNGAFVLLFRRIFQITIITTIMSFCVVFTLKLLSLWLDYTKSATDSFITVLICGTVGVVVYFLLSYKLNMFSKVLGKDITKRFANRFKKRRRGSVS